MAWPQIKTVGLAGLIVMFSASFSDQANRAAIAFKAAVTAQGWPEVAECHSTLVSTFLRIDLSQHRPDPLKERLQDLLASRDWFHTPLPAGRVLWRVPTLFGTERAPQLAQAAELAGRTEDEAIKELSSRPMRVLTIGFAPGQPYLGTLPAHWNLPRQVQITPNVPAGSLVCAVRQFCLFPYATPTGWRHVGATGFLSFRPGADNPFPLNAGDEMLFEPVTAKEFSRIEAKDTSGNGGARTEVMS